MDDDELLFGQLLLSKPGLALVDMISAPSLSWLREALCTGRPNAAVPVC
jgi:hypothetical protein